MFELFEQSNVLVGQVWRGVVNEVDNEVDVASRGIEIGSPRCQAEDDKPAHTMSAAERTNCVTVVLDFSDHVGLSVAQTPAPAATRLMVVAAWTAGIGPALGKRRLASPTR